MPIFEYRCPQCGFQKEALVKSGSVEPLSCPNCGKATLEKMLSAPAVIPPSSCPVSGQRMPSGGCPGRCPHAH